MNHYFDTNIAKKYGVNAAVILQNIIFWTKKNSANNSNLIDGYFWVYNSVSAWKELFPYLSEKQIRTALDKLEKECVIKSGNHNAYKYDRTKWYAIIDKSILLLGEIHLPKSTNGIVQNGEPIPDNKPDNKQYIGKSYENVSDFSLDKDTHIDNVSSEYLEALEKHLKQYIETISLKRISVNSPLGEPLSYEDFIETLKTKNSYKFKNFVLVYKRWLKRDSEKTGARR